MSGDVAQRTRLEGRVTDNLEVLLKRFENIMQLAPVEGKDKSMTVAEAYEIETHASSMIRAAEDLLAMTRSLKEAWLFGQLSTGPEAESTTSQDAKAVGETLQRLIEKAKMDTSS